MNPCISMIDMHAHICSYKNAALAAKELAFRAAAGIYTFFSTGTPDEYRFMNRLLKENKADCKSAFEITFGIHPWYADRWNPGDWMEYYRNCPVVGEIGMDDLWCDIPLKTQQKVLEEQLAIAADLKKPIVLHTKACEARIARIIRDFPYAVLIHWYSGDPETLFTYIDQGCFFTLGPDAGFANIRSVKSGPADAGRDETTCTGYILKNVPPDRLFVETDGLDAILWAYKTAGIKPPLTEGPDAGLSLIGQILEGTVGCIARHRSVTKEDVCRQMMRNLSGSFLSH